MTEYCSDCGEKLKEEALFCPNCGRKIPNKNKGFLNKYTILIIIVLIVLAIFLSSSLFLNQTQTVMVDNLEFEIPADYVSEPSRTEVSIDENVKSTAMAWSNDEYFIEIGVSKTPGMGFNSEEVVAGLGGTPTKMYGYTGYLLDYDEEGFAFVFPLRDEVCMVYVSDYDAFGEVNLISVND